jgi:hypothetical protein
MSKGFLQERKLKILTRTKSFSFRNWVALSVFEADAGAVFGAELAQGLSLYRASRI